MSNTGPGVKIPKKARVGLALGSGSARGWAHIGVIKALTEAGIEVDCIAGTSIGAVVGAVHAAGRLETLEEVVLGFDWKQIASFFDVVLPKSGLLDGRKISRFIHGYVRGLRMEELPIPFWAVATDLCTGRKVVLREGDVIEAVRASISVPGIFTPVQKDRMVLADGALVDPVPVEVVREMGADYVIAVDLNHNLVEKRKGPSGPGGLGPKPGEGGPGLPAERRGRVRGLLNKSFEAVEFPALAQLRQWAARDPLPNIFEVLMASINIMETQVTETRLRADRPDLLIRPDLGHIRFLEFNRAQEAISEGYQETLACLGRPGG